MEKVTVFLVKSRRAARVSLGILVGVQACCRLTANYNAFSTLCAVISDIAGLQVLSVTSVIKVRSVRRYTQSAPEIQSVLGLVDHWSEIED